MKTHNIEDWVGNYFLLPLLGLVGYCHSTEGDTLILGPLTDGFLSSKLYKTRQKVSWDVLQEYDPEILPLDIRQVKMFIREQQDGSAPLVSFFKKATGFLEQKYYSVAGNIEQRFEETWIPARLKI